MLRLKDRLSVNKIIFLIPVLLISIALTVSIITYFVNYRKVTLKAYFHDYGIKIDYDSFDVIDYYHEDAFHDAVTVYLADIKTTNDCGLFDILNNSSYSDADTERMINTLRDSSKMGNISFNFEKKESMTLKKFYKDNSLRRYLILAFDADTARLLVLIRN